MARAAEVQPFLFHPTPERNWLVAKDGEQSIRNVLDHHYSRALGDPYRRGNPRKLKYVGLGAYLLLRTDDCKAIYAWRFIPAGGGTIRGGYEGLYCVFFRNEGYRVQSSDLIREAVEMAAERWPDVKDCFTFVDGTAVQSSNPGYCFQKAGWWKDGFTKGRHLQILRYRIGE